MDSSEAIYKINLTGKSALPEEAADRIAEKNID